MCIFIRFCFFWILSLSAWAQHIFKSTDCVGEMAGKCITYKEFTELMAEEMQLSQVQEKRAVEIVWNNLLYERIYLPEIKKMGIQLTKEEIELLMWGDSTQVHSSVRQQFTNPQSRRFERETLLEIKEQTKTDLVLKKRVETFIAGLVKDKLRTDWEGLMLNSIYVPKAEVTQEQKVETEKSRIRFVCVPYESLPDSSFLSEITDQALEKELKANPNTYKSQESTDIVYLALPVVASKEDTINFKQKMRDLAREWKLARNLWSYAHKNTNVKSSKKQFDTYKTPRELPKELFKQHPKLFSGGVYGPFQDGKTHKIVYVVDIKKDSTQSNVRASHILFKADRSYSDSDKEKTRKDAQAVLDSLKKGANFAEMAHRHGSDGTAQNGGDLGWFGKGQMVKSFEEAIFGAGKEGLLPQLVLTDFGYHVVEVTALPTQLTYQVAVIERFLEPSEETQKQILENAKRILTRTKNVQELERFAKENPNYVLEKSEGMSVYTSALQQIQYTKGVTKWAFNATEGETGLINVGEGITLEHWIIAGLTQKIDAGEISVRASRRKLTERVLQGKKAQHIISKINLQESSLEKIAEKYGKEAILTEIDSLSIQSSSLGHGVDPEVVGKAVGLPEGKRIVVIGEAGVYVIEKIKNFVDEQTENLRNISLNLLKMYEGMNSYYVQEAVKKLKKVKDYRYKFW